MDIQYRELLQDMQSRIHWFIIEKLEDMKMPAYDESYLDGMITKTRYLFKLIGRLLII